MSESDRVGTEPFHDQLLYDAPLTRDGLLYALACFHDDVRLIANIRVGAIKTLLEQLELPQTPP